MPSNQMPPEVEYLLTLLDKPEQAMWSRTYLSHLQRPWSRSSAHQRRIAAYQAAVAVLESRYPGEASPRVVTRGDLP